MRHSVTFYVRDMSTCGTHSTTQPTAQLNNVSLRLLVFVPNIAGLLGHTVPESCVEQTAGLITRC